ncbi:MAG: helicase-related protein, partial [Thermoproteota archaeon]
MIKAIVCTSTLELGIDIGTADLVIQYLSPRQVGPFIQRVSRFGHRLGLTSEGVILTAFLDDALESIAVVSRTRSEKVEPTKIHEGALDVLAHQIVGLSLDHGGISLSKAVEIVSRAYPFRRLDKKEFQKVAGFLSKLGLI